MADAPNTAPVSEAPTAPEPAAVSQPPQAAPEAAPPERDPALPPRWHELGKAAKADLQRRQEQEQREQDARDAKAFREMMARGGLQQPQAQPQQSGKRTYTFDPDDYGSVMEAFRDDPGRLRAWLNGFATHIANPQQARLARELQELRSAKPEGLDELRTTVQQLAQEREAERVAAVERSFVAHTESVDGETQRYPLLAKLPAHERLALGHDLAARYREAGVSPEQLTHQFLSTEAEDYLRQYFTELGFLQPQPIPAPAATPKPAQRSQSTAPKRVQGTRSLTNEHTVPRTPEKPLRGQAREQWAIERLRARRSAGG